MACPQLMKPTCWLQLGQLRLTRVSHVVLHSSFSGDTFADRKRGLGTIEMSSKTRTSSPSTSTQNGVDKPRTGPDFSSPSGAFEIMAKRPGGDVLTSP